MPLRSHTNLGQLFAASAGMRAGRDLIVDARWRLDGRVAERETVRRAALLADAGVRFGGRVAFLCRPSAAHAVTWFAAVRLGAAATNLHVLETDRRLAETLDWLEADALVCDQEFLDRARAIQAETTTQPHLRVLDADPSSPTTLAEGREGNAAPALDRASRDDVAAICLSSGSTGRPKGAIHTHGSLLANAAAGPEVYGEITAFDSVLVAIGTSFGGWLNIVLPFLGAGAKLVFQPRFEPQDFLRGLAAERITHAPLVPTMWRHVLAAGPEDHDLSALRSAFMSGEAAGADVVEAVLARMAPSVRSAYLSTEGGCACGIVAEQRRGEPLAGPGGLPVPGCELRIAPAEGGPESEGEILLRAPSLAKGYWKDAERTARCFKDGWWRTGDVGRLSPDGRIALAGRVDHVINSGGIKIQAEEVELALMRHPNVAQAAVIGVPDPEWGQRVEAFVVPKAAQLDPGAVLEWCRDDGILPALKLPKRIHVRDRLPTGATGKLYRPALFPEAGALR
ncbi:class I adenylate-forming enzyme family protein [Enterovirga aerilata]|uniref:Acyl--CoA ligase n=1 Tax=Enterovirga aerilata TaxID=2730920 RepID=A0A849I6Q3_9HYPH|nr:class I adenylate-forming enzyme family protein [Enterovirga sp. DB1703]NNM75162.1 acyl--CoA ligase [Enterovirga sp. DB1703]